MTMQVLNVDDLNFDLYFEFYLLEDFFDRYTYDCTQTESTLNQLCQAITHQLYLNYNYRKFTGYSFDGSQLTYGLLASINDHCIMQIKEDNEYIRDFPLDLMTNEITFGDQLYLNLLLVLESKIEPSDFRKLVYPLVGKIKLRTKNPIWPILYEEQTFISPFVDSQIRKFNLSLQKIKKFHRIDKINELKIELANQLMKFQQTLEKEINRTLHLYESTLKIIQKDNLNQLKQGEEVKIIKYFESNLKINDVNKEIIRFCYGDLDEISDDSLIEYLKYFTLKHFELIQCTPELGQLNFCFRTRFIEIMEMKDKIIKSITSQVEELTK